MVNNRVYIICISTIPNFCGIKEYREFSEKVIGFFNHQPLWYGAWFLKKQAFGDRKSRMYRKNTDNTYFDHISLEEFGGFDIAGTNLKKSNYANFYLSFKFEHEKGQIYTTMVIEPNKCTKETQFEQVNDFIKMIQEISDMNYTSNYLIV